MTDPTATTLLFTQSKERDGTLLRGGPVCPPVPGEGMYALSAHLMSSKTYAALLDAVPPQ